MTRNIIIIKKVYCEYNRTWIRFWLLNQVVGTQRKPLDLVSCTFHTSTFSSEFLLGLQKALFHEVFHSPASNPSLFLIIPFRWKDSLCFCHSHFLDLYLTNLSFSRSNFFLLSVLLSLFSHPLTKSLQYLGLLSANRNITFILHRSSHISDLCVSCLHVYSIHDVF